MKWDDILAVFREFSCSQGFYGRLLRDLHEIQKNNPEQYQKIIDVFESQNFKTALDVILYIEQ